MEIFTTGGITILDSTMKENEVRLIKSIKELYGFEIKNDTGHHLFIEAEFNFDKLSKLIIRR